MDTRRILERLYGVKPRESRLARLRKLVLRYHRDFILWLRPHSFRLALGTTLLVGWVVGHVAYYNRLLTLEYKVQEARASIEVIEQRRNHVGRNVRQLLLYYAGYEQDVMTGITALRSGRPAPPRPPAVPGAEPGSLADLLGRLSVVAEQYPNLQLTQTVQQFTNTVINTEGEIALRIDRYNASVNAYATVLDTFPGVIFGPLLGFDDYPYYQYEDRSILVFRELDL